MDDKERLARLCVEALRERELYDKTHRDRLKLEMWDVNAQNEHGYLLALHDHEARFPENENNLLIAYLLGVCPAADMSKPPRYTFGDYPDVDIDYLPVVRNYLKGEYAAKEFGGDRVCNIASYTTFGLRSALLDTARVYGLERSEIQEITKKIGSKDEDGEPLTWDTALETYDGLREYAERNPEVAKAAKKLLNRTRTLTQHASGLIIAGCNIKDFVPLVRGKDGSPASAWVEGLHGSDLGAVGLVKYDFLSLDANYKIALACHLIKQNYGITSICALEGREDWSDTDYLNDTPCMEAASAGDLRLVFQFDGSEGIRKLAKQGGVTTFNDLVAYTALYRPGPMKMKMHEAYCNRKKGEEDYEIHPLLQDVLGYTYGVLCYQEQTLKILHKVGKIPLKDCEDIRKAISKKKIDKFADYKKMFIANGQVVLGWTEEQVDNLWQMIEAFGTYAFNLSHSVAYSFISARMLYLKVHFPLEFFCAFLQVMKLGSPEDYQTLKEYKRDAKSFGRDIEICPIDIKKSRNNFHIEDGKIYYGFSNIKGIGEEIGQKIAENQPYDNLTDYLDKFGTEAKPAQALIGLGCFGEDRLDKYLYYMAYKTRSQKKRERQKRFDDGMLKMKQQLLELTGGENFCVESDNPAVLKLQKKYDKVMMNYWEAMNDQELPYVSEKFIEKPLKDILCDESMEKAQAAFYGFIWRHPLEKHPQYKGLTFGERTEAGTIGPVEVLVKKVIERESKNKPGLLFYDLVCEDANNQVGFVRVWRDDMELWGEEFVPGAILRIRVTPPTPPWNNFTLESRPNRYSKPDKEKDARVVIYKVEHSPEVRPVKVGGLFDKK